MFKAPPTVDIEVGKMYPFYCEMQQEYLLPAERMRRFTGTIVTVIERSFGPDDPDWIEGENSERYTVRTWDGTEFEANIEEINGWDYALDQFFWIDGTHGKAHGTQFLANERT